MIFLENDFNLRGYFSINLNKGHVNTHTCLRFINHLTRGRSFASIDHRLDTMTINYITGFHCNYNSNCDGGHLLTTNLTDFDILSITGQCFRHNSNSFRSAYSLVFSVLSITFYHCPALRYHTTFTSRFDERITFTAWHWANMMRNKTNYPAVSSCSYSV